VFEKGIKLQNDISIEFKKKRFEKKKGAGMQIGALSNLRLIEISLELA